MIKIFIIGFTTLMLFLVNTFFQTGEKIKIDQNYPAIIQAGDEFTISLTIHKTDIKGLARLQQYLPAGCEVTPVEKHGAEFSFEDNSIKFVWLNLPDESDFNVSYKIKTAKNILDKISITGLFVYSENDKTQRYGLSPVEIMIGNPVNANAAIPVVSRQLICISKDPGEYKVILTFYPNKVNEQAQFTDIIPDGFTAEQFDSHQSDFRFENQKVIFNWNNLPSDSSFIVSYLVKSVSVQTPPVINGELVYGHETVTAEQPLMQENPGDQVFPVTETDASKNEGVIDQEAPLAAVSMIIPDVKNLPVAQNGIVFKVQISATKRSPVRNNNWFSYNYHIDSDVELTNHEGWNKYIVGSFQAYNDASDFRNKTREKVTDAFVVAYENGVRIPVSEALRSKPLIQ